MSRAQSHPSSKLTFIADRGEVVDGPLEWSECLIELDIALGNFVSLAITLQGETLEPYMVQTKEGSVIRVKWPKSGPGHYLLRVEHSGSIYENTVTILPSKIGRHEYVALLEELEYKLPCLIALKLQRCGALSGTKIEPPRVSTVEQERHRFFKLLRGTKEKPGILQLLEELREDQHVKLADYNMLVASENSTGRIVMSRLQEVFHAPNNFSRSGMPIRIPTVTSVVSNDTYENRFVAWFADLVLQRLSRFCAALQLIDRNEAERFQNAKRLLQRRTAFLDGVRGELGEPRHLSMVLLNKPLYRAILETYLEFLRHAVVAIEEQKLERPLNAFPDLYQLWGTLKVVEVATSVCADNGFRCDYQNMFRRVGGTSLLRLPGRGHNIVQFSHSNGTKVLVRREPIYTRTSRTVRSITNDQIPDIVVEITKEGARTKLLVFDPKYKLHNAGEPVKADIDKMHVYSDALRNEEGKRVTEYAAILYPGQHVSYTATLAALPATPSRAAELKELLSATLTYHIVAD